MDADLRIKKFVDEFILPSKRPLPGLRPEHRMNPNNGEEWDDWIEVESPVVESDLKAMEVKYGFTFPELLKSYFKYKIIFDGDFGLYRFPDMTPDKPLDGLESQISVVDDFPKFHENQLIPFAQDGNDGGPICFKYSQDAIANGFPIYFVDHELFNRQDYDGELIHDSFMDLLQAIENGN